MLERLVLRYYENHDFSILKMAAVRHLGFLKLKFKIETFCVILPNFMKIARTVAEILRFFYFYVFLVKCKKSLNDRT